MSDQGMGKAAERERIEDEHRRLQEQHRRRAEGVDAGYASSPMGENYFDPKAEKIFRECAASGEPIIIFRAKDILSIMVLAHYQTLLEMYVPENNHFHQRVSMKAAEVREWQTLNPGAVHLPD